MVHNEIIFATNETVYNTFLDHEANELYEIVYGSIDGKISFYVCTFLISFVGPIFFGGLILYETQGGDPQKRTIVNRLLSCIFGITLLYGIYWGLIRLLRNSCGLLPNDVMLWVGFFDDWVKDAGLLFFNELTILRYLYIVIWRRLKVINDDFWMVFLCLTTLAISFIIATTQFMIGRRSKFGSFITVVSHEIEEDAIDKESSWFSKLWLVYITIPLQFYCICHIAYQKFKLFRQEKRESVVEVISVNISNGKNSQHSRQQNYCSAEPNSQRINNNTYNKFIFEASHALFLLTFVGLQAGLIHMGYESGGRNTWKSISPIWLRMFDLGPPILLHVLFPLYFYVSHRDAITYIRRMIFPEKMISPLN